MEETIAEIAAALNAGRLTSRALVERCLARIAALDGRFNSFVALDEAGALAAARESDARSRAARRARALEGVPLSIKDNIHAAGLPSTWGSRALATLGLTSTNCRSRACGPRARSSLARRTSRNSRLKAIQATISSA